MLFLLSLVQICKVTKKLHSLYSFSVFIREEHTFICLQIDGNSARTFYITCIPRFCLTTLFVCLSFFFFLMY